MRSAFTLSTVMGLRTSLVSSRIGPYRSPKVKVNLGHYRILTAIFRLVIFVYR